MKKSDGESPSSLGTVALNFSFLSLTISLASLIQAERVALSISLKEEGGGGDEVVVAVADSSLCCCSLEAMDSCVESFNLVMRRSN